MTRRGHFYLNMEFCRPEAIVKEVNRLLPSISVNNDVAVFEFIILKLEYSGFLKLFSAPPFPFQW